MNKKSDFLKIIKLKTIDKSETENRTVLDPSNTDRVFVPIVGEGGDTDYICGNCDRKLAQNVFEGQIRKIIIRCPDCRKYNEFE